MLLFAISFRNRARNRPSTYNCFIVDNYGFSAEPMLTSYRRLFNGGEISLRNSSTLIGASLVYEDKFSASANYR